MWQALAGYAVRGPVQGALLSFSTLLLALIFPPLVVVSNALVALIWLRLGPQKGLISVAVALLAGTFIASFSGNPVFPAALMLSFWLPVVLMAYLLRRTVSLNLALLAGAALALVGVLVTYLVIDDPAQSWQSMVQQIRAQTEAASAGTAINSSNEAANARVEAWLANAGTWMTGFSAATQFLVAASSLLLARVWQARMFNPGGLQKEFHALRFGLAAGAVGLFIVAASVFIENQMLTNLAIVVIVVFAFQGLAVLHAITAKLKMHVLVLVGIYAFLIMLAPDSVKVLGMLGLADTWVDFRSRVRVNKSDSQDI